MLRTWIIAFVLTVLTTVPAQSASVTVQEMAVTTRVARGKPIDAVHRISHRSVRALYCFTRLTSINAAPGQQLRHVWSRNGVQVQENVLTITGRQPRLVSTLPLSKDSTGAWRVELLDGSDTPLKTIVFQVH